MGFQKGSITLSSTQDMPLLLQVAHSRCVTHDQLFEFMCLSGVELKRVSFNWRVRRLVEGGLLNRSCAKPVTASPVYSLTSVAALMLAGHIPVLDNGKEKDVDASAVHLTHSIGLNELRLSLARQSVLVDWQSEVMIWSTNELTGSGYLKDYDAVVTVRIGNRGVSFALEYERTAKKATDYLRIRRLLEREIRLNRFLYIVPEPKLSSFILDCFSGTTAPVFVGLESDFIQSFMDMNIVEASCGLTRRVSTAL